MTEIQRYRVLSNQDGFEIRSYEPFITISTIENGTMAEAGNRAFRPLANFIFGGNKASQQIAMTAPVTQVRVADGYRVSFVMPASMRIEDMPEPATPDVVISNHPAGEYAALKFSGLASEQLFRRKETLLRKKLEQKGTKALPTATYARYNGPWTPGPLRRNEVLIPLSE